MKLNKPPRNRYRMKGRSIIQTTGKKLLQLIDSRESVIYSALGIPSRSLETNLELAHWMPRLINTKKKKIRETAQSLPEIHE